MLKKIVIRTDQKPRDQNIINDIDWICNSLGLSNGRDLDQLSNKIIQTLLYKIAKEEKVSTEIVAQDLKTTASRVNHHIRNLMDAGFLDRQKKIISLRGGSLKNTIMEVKKDTDRIFNELIEIAEQIDSEIGLKNR